MQYVVVDLPLRIHKNAEKAAQASRCAKQQGKFWEVHDALFKQVGALEIQNIVAIAKQLSLDVAKFRACLGSTRHLTAIRQSVARADAAGITGTPTFILGRMDNGEISGRKIVGALPCSVFAGHIQELLRDAR